MKKLSELEGASLGIIYDHQPCTAYYVRNQLKESPSSHWQASAGSIYPLLKRLEDQGIILSTSDCTDGRGKKLLNVTKKGREYIKMWILSGTEKDMISSISDPIRSRMFFLGLLNKKQQLEYLDNIINQMQDFLIEIKNRHLQPHGFKNKYIKFGSLGAIKITEARLEWLTTIHIELQKQ